MNKKNIQNEKGLVSFEFIFACMAMVIVLVTYFDFFKIFQRAHQTQAESRAMLMEFVGTNQIIASEENDYVDGEIINEVDHDYYNLKPFQPESHTVIMFK